MSCGGVERMVARLSAVALAVVVLSLLGCRDRGLRPIRVVLGPGQTMTFLRDPPDVRAKVQSIGISVAETGELVCATTGGRFGGTIERWEYAQKPNGFENIGCSPLRPGIYQADIQAVDGGMACRFCVDGSGQFRASRENCGSKFERFPDLGDSWYGCAEQ
jgi:hypothetical protein